LSTFYLHTFSAAVCNPQCVNNGTCISPGLCHCTTGWPGDHCTEGTVECVYIALIFIAGTEEPHVTTLAVAVLVFINFTSDKIVDSFVRE